tara:strand:- start:5958 stop:6380 length:423 start_codon:yes stop_codon:yes gene_type:complete
MKPWIALFFICICSGCSLSFLQLVENKIQGTWRVTHIAHRRALNYSMFKMTFQPEGQFKIQSSCQEALGVYELDGKRFHMEINQHTNKACIEELRMQERMIINYLTKVKKISVQQEHIVLFDIFERNLIELDFLESLQSI